MPDEKDIDEKDIVAWTTKHGQIKNKMAVLKDHIREIGEKLNIEMTWPKTFQGGLVSVLKCIPEERYQDVIHHLNGVQHTSV